MNWDPYQKATDTAPSSVPWRPPVPLFFGAGRAPIGRSVNCCYGTTHSVGLDNTGKRTRSVQNRDAAEALTFPREVQR